MDIEKLAQAARDRNDEVIWKEEFFLDGIRYMCRTTFDAEGRIGYHIRSARSGGYDTRHAGQQNMAEMREQVHCTPSVQCYCAERNPDFHWSELLSDGVVIK